MKLFVSAGFAEPLDIQTAEKCLHVAQGIRTAVAVNDIHDDVKRVVSNAATYFGRCIFIVGGWDWRRPSGEVFQRRDANLEDAPGGTHLANQCESILSVWREAGREDEGCWFEIGNELDGSHWKDDLDAFHRIAMTCYDRIRSLSEDCPIITGSTMNFNVGPLMKDEGYEVLRELCEFNWPLDTIQGLHPYRTECHQDEWPSWENSDDALVALGRVLRGRQVAITEMGWPSGEWFRDDEIAKFVSEEIEMWRQFGSACYDHYQIQDGRKPKNTSENGFGAYSNITDGMVLKPVATALHIQRTSPS